MSTEYTGSVVIENCDDMPISEVCELDGPGWLGTVYSPVYGEFDVSVYLVDYDYGAYELLLDYGDVEPISVTLAPSDTLRVGIEMGLTEMGK